MFGIVGLKLDIRFFFSRNGDEKREKPRRHTRDTGEARCALKGEPFAARARAPRFPAAFCARGTRHTAPEDWVHRPRRRGATRLCDRFRTARPASLGTSSTASRSEPRPGAFRTRRNGAVRPSASADRPNTRGGCGFFFAPAVRRARVAARCEGIRRIKKKKWRAARCVRWCFWPY